ncbi:MAG: alanine:cation symporter family protein, partial [Prochloron sp. SP5CPC1]|nr:alanine:cation symporter family protein [Candidatus Paraprochloron terpiosi SP5CPC1]
ELEGAALTSQAYGLVIDWFPILLALSVFFFAISTMISWSYYGEKSWDYLFGATFGEGSAIVYKVLFLMAIFIGSVANPGAVIDFSDGMIFFMAFPNLLGAYLLSNKVVKDLQEYTNR